MIGRLMRARMNFTLSATDAKGNGIGHIPARYRFSPSDDALLWLRLILFAFDILSKDLRPVRRNEALLPIAAQLGRTDDVIRHRRPAYP